MAKEMNFAGGIPNTLQGEIIGLASGVLQPGLQPVDANNILVALLREEQEGKNPGPGVIGLLDALAAFDELKQAKDQLKAAQAAQVGTAVTRLTNAIDALAKLWKKGGVAPGFYSSDSQPPSKS